MGFLDIFRMPDMRKGLEAMDEQPGAVLVDVRTPEEYREGRIPGSVNVPLSSLDKIRSVAENEAVPLFVYCQSGARSRQAVSQLLAMGYTAVTNLGGMAAYRGKVER